MRQFFIDQLKKFQLRTGYGVNIPQEQVSELITEMVSVCNKFGKLPEEVKQKVIARQILQDTDLKKLTPAKIYHWLSYHWSNLDPATKNNYMRDPIEKPEGYRPLEGEERDKYLKQWKQELSKVGTPQPKSSKERILGDKSNESITNKLEFEIVDCEGHIDKSMQNMHPSKVKRLPCTGDTTCFGCDGSGKVKRIKQY